MQKQRLTCNHLSTLGKLILDGQKVIVRRQKKIKRTPIRSPAMRPPRTKTKQSPKPSLLLMNLRIRPPRKISAVVGGVMEAIQLLGSMLPR